MTDHFKVYGDLNCPFCFALHERLGKLNLQPQWCYVEHAPEQNSTTMTDEQKALLKYEFDLLQQRATDVDALEPAFCINSQLAIHTLMMVENECPEKAALFRSNLYRGYWQQGRDISDLQFIYEILEQLNIQISADLTQVVRQQHQWQEEWQTGNFDRRIPALVAPNGEVMLGLQHPDNIQNFFQQVKHQQIISGQSCHHHGDFYLSILGDENLAERINKVGSGIKIRCFDELSDLIKGCKRQRPDGIICRYDMDRSLGFEVVRTVRDCMPVGVDFPFVYFSNQANSGEEVHAFTLGATDYQVANGDIAPVIARLKHSMQQARNVRVLHRYAIVDGLTGLMNKREFEQRLEREWRDAVRNKKQLSLIMLDIDYFKLYNDAHGHCAGDDVLRLVAQKLSEALFRPRDQIARFGGEEFVVLLPETDMSGLGFVCEALSKAVEKLAMPHPASPVIPRISLSMGGCFAHPHADQSPMDMMKLADDALYQAKNKGRNQYFIRQLHPPGYAR